ncbi:MAG TPA: PH domain-containing protein [Ktedonobacterales bacterium]
MVQHRQGPPQPPAHQPVQPGQPQRPTFHGQQPEEVVDFVIGPHPLWYFSSSWKLLVLVCVLLGIYFLVELMMFFSVPGVVLIVITAIAVGIHFARWIAEDLNNWIFRKYILTDWRVVDHSGLLYQRQDQCAIERIQQIRVTRPNIIAAWLDIGDVELVTAGERSDVKLEGVHHPRQVALRINMAIILHGEKHFAEAVPIRNPAVRAVIDRFEEQDHPAPPPPTPARSARHQLSIAMLPNEVVLECIRRHWFYFLMKAWGAFAFAIGGIVVGGLLGVVDGRDVGATPQVLALMGIAIGGVWALSVWLNYADDFLVLTTHRVIDIDRYFYFIEESAAEARYSRVQDVQVTISALGELFGFGTVSIETAGRAANLEMDYMPKPIEVQNRIFARIDAAESRTQRTIRRYRRREFRRWMGMLLNDMLIEVPDLRGLSVLEATGRARAAQLRLIIGEERYDPSMPPGRVVEQMPREGSTALLASEITVVLSRR